MYPTLHFLTESPQERLRDPEQIALRIMRHAREYIQATGFGDHVDPQGMLLRGIRRTHSTDDIAAVFTVREDRKPRNTPPEMNDLFNEILELSGTSVRRENALFTTGEYNDAKSYGSAGVVIPLGPYEFVWSTKVSDMFSDITKMSRMIPFVSWCDQHEGDSTGNALWFFMEHVKSFDAAVGYDHKDPSEYQLDEYKDETPERLVVAMWFIDFWNQFKSRIEASSDHAIVVIRSMRDFHGIDSIITAGLQSIADTYKTTELDAAIRRGGEVMVRCKKYMWIDIEEWHQVADALIALQSEQ